MSGSLRSCAVPAVPLPGEPTLRAVRRLEYDAPDGVPLNDAAVAASAREAFVIGVLDDWDLACCGLGNPRSPYARPKTRSLACRVVSCR
jgi:hypothetical protein